MPSAAMSDGDQDNPHAEIEPGGFAEIKGDPMKVDSIPLAKDPQITEKL